MQRNFLDKFLEKISDFPAWIKEIIYVRLKHDVSPEGELSYTFATFKPSLTDKGKCELDNKTSGFDSNIYNIFEYCDNGASISDITPSCTKYSPVLNFPARNPAILRIWELSGI